MNRKEIQNLIEKAAALQDQYSKLDPHERATFDKLFEQNKAHFEFLAEIVEKIQSGSMSAETAQVWLDESGKQFEDAEKRRM